MKRAEKKDTIKINLKEKDNDEVVFIKSKKSDEFDLEKLEKLIKKKDQDKE